MLKLRNKSEEHWYVIEQIFEENCWKNIMVKEWPGILFDTVKVGLAEYLKLIADQK